MRRQITITFVLIFGLFTLGAGVLIYNMYSTSSQLRSLIGLHEIGEIQHDFFYRVQEVQDYVHSNNTTFSEHLDEIISHTEEMDMAVERCHSCHHEPNIKAEIKAIQQLVVNFEQELSYLITMIADSNRRRNMQDQVSNLGDTILSQIKDMIVRAENVIQKRRNDAFNLLDKTYPLFGLTLIVTLLLAFLVARLLTRRITEPIDALVTASRKISEGKWGYQTDYKATHEFAELIQAFNSMSSSLASEKKQIQEQMHQLETTQNQLIDTEKMTAIGTLAGGIAHDFNNILSAILGYTEMSLWEVDPESPVGKNLTVILQGVRRASELTKQILTFSRKSESNLAPISIQPVIYEVVKLLRASIPATIEIQVENDKESGNTRVMANQTKIHQVILNLCTNSYHAMRESGGVLKIATTTLKIDQNSDVPSGLTLSPGSYLCIEVCDTGHGIDDETLKRIFEPFFTTKQKGEGTGMGLAVVHGIIKSHNGDISVFSKTGEGTTFRLCLPTVENDSDWSDTSSYKSTFEEMPRGHERILIVDDEETIVALLQETLSSLGYQVTAQTKSIDAYQLFQSSPDDFDLLLTDMDMPNMTGSELAQKVLSTKPSMKIILCTGFSDAIDEEKALQIGIKGYLLKPIILAEIAQKIRDVLEEKKG